MSVALAKKDEAPVEASFRAQARTRLECASRISLILPVPVHAPQRRDNVDGSRKSDEDVHALIVRLACRQGGRRA